MKGKKIRHPGLIDSQILEMVIEIIDKKVGMWKLNEIEHQLIEKQQMAIKVLPI